MRQFMTIAAMCVGLAACGGPLARVEKLDDVALADPDAAVAALPSAAEVDAQNQSFFARMRARMSSADAGQKSTLASSSPGDTAATDSLMSNQAPAAVATETSGSDDPVAAAAPILDAIAASGDAKPKGVLGWLRRQKSSAGSETEPQTALAGQALADKPVAPEPIVMASLSDAVSNPETGNPLAKPKEKHGFLGLFSGRGGANTSKDAVEIPEIAFGSTIPFGEVALVCGKKPAELGTKIDSYPDKRPVYTLYDSAPGQITPHALYLTGFKDGCARQISASVAMFGSLGQHEQLRYVLPDEVRPFSDTDNAYEKLKRKICGVARFKPCGKPLDKLSRQTVFVSTYDRYGDATGWASLLLHDGQLLATDVKTN